MGKIVKVHKLFKGVNRDTEKKKKNYVTLALWTSPRKEKEIRKKPQRAHKRLETCRILCVEQNKGIRAFSIENNLNQVILTFSSEPIKCLNIEEENNRTRENEK